MCKAINLGPRATRRISNAKEDARRHLGEQNYEAVLEDIKECERLCPDLKSHLNDVVLDSKTDNSTSVLAKVLTSSSVFRGRVKRYVNITRCICVNVSLCMG